MNQTELEEINRLRKQILDEGTIINGMPHPALLALPKLMKKAGVKFTDFIKSPAAIQAAEPKADTLHIPQAAA
jgi:hypothetical protein